MAQRPAIENNLERIRKSRGLGPSDLARRVGISRQTIYAIEAGTFVPNTEVALRLARELEVSVDEIFALREEGPASADTLSATVLSAAPPAEGQPVRICRVGSRWVGVPVSATPYFIPEADGVVKRAGARPELLAFSSDEASQKRILLAGCDPATSLLARMVEKTCGIEIVYAAASSRLALSWLKKGDVHVAGSHLQDPISGEFNLPFIRKEFPEGDMLVVTFARWEEGFVVAADNPKHIRSVADVARRGVAFVNREPGSGARALLDRLITEAGLAADAIHGYDRIALGHLAAAYTVLSGDADVCLATRSAAHAFGLGFVPLRVARYDLVMRKRTAELPAMKAFLDVLQRSTLRRKLEALAGYDTSETGAIVAC